MSEKTKFCRHCGTENDTDAVFCTECGKDMSKNIEAEPVVNTAQTNTGGDKMAQPTVTRPNKVNQPSFMKFEKMITPSIIQGIFILSVIVSLLAGIGFLIGGSIIFGLGIIVLGPLLSRIYCELIIVIFKIHESLQIIARK